MKKVELLSPAGSFESLVAAITCGADAIYLGGTKFGARAFASNFNDDEMIKAVNYAHLYGVKIYVTVNTLIYDEEVTPFLEYITFLHKIGVDAFIIQDFGMLHLLAKTFPNLELHASTQMHIHNIDAFKKIKDLGIKRAVLPRELSLNEVTNLKQASGMDIEVFIQGALCVSYSGQCLMSYLIGGRSGNRGECAGSCRLPYQLIEKDDAKERIIDTKGDYPLSTKDLYTLDNIDKIIESGVDSLKIEGRMKRPEYVALVTMLYRKAIDSYYDGIKYQVSDEDITNLRKMFNRGFTKGYILGDRGKGLMNPLRPNHMGIAVGKVIEANNDYMIIKLDEPLALGDGIRIISEEDTGFTINQMYKDNVTVKEAFRNDAITINGTYNVKQGDNVLKTTDIKLMKILREGYHRSRPNVIISGTVVGVIGKPLILTINDGINEVIVKSSMKITRALTNPVTRETISEKLRKTGDTPYVFDYLTLTIDDNMFIPLTAINAIKRESLDKMSDMRMHRQVDNRVIPYDIKVSDLTSNKVMLKAKVRTKEQYQACIDNNIDQIYIENRHLYDEVKGDKRVILVLPRVNKSKEGISKTFVAGELGSVSQKSIVDYSLNVVNSYAVAFMHLMGAMTVTLSYEMNLKAIEQLIKAYKNQYLVGPNLEVIIYGRIEAMISAYCPLNTYLHREGETCQICSNHKKYFLRDRFHNDYVLTFDNCLMTVYDYKKRNILNDIKSLISMGVNNLRLNFVDEDYEECSKIITAAKVNL
ncbi:MAG: DUF3656 domain-containing protein [Bacilli bacterium]